MEKGSITDYSVVEIEDNFDALFKGALPKHFERARMLKAEMTKAEKTLWEELRGRKLNGLKFRRQHPLENFILDFYCAEEKLAIEVDGAIHDLDEQKEFDQLRTARLNELGVRILRFRNEIVENDIKGILAQIIALIKSP